MSVNIDPLLLNLRMVFVAAGLLIILFAPKVGLVWSWKDRGEWPWWAHAGYVVSGLTVFGISIWIKTDPDGSKSMRVATSVLRFFGITL